MQNSHLLTSKCKKLTILCFFCFFSQNNVIRHWDLYWPQNSLSKFYFGIINPFTPRKRWKLQQIVARIVKIGSTRKCLDMKSRKRKISNQIWTILALENLMNTESLVRVKKDTWSKYILVQNMFKAHCGSGREVKKECFHWFKFSDWSKKLILSQTSLTIKEDYLIKPVWKFAISTLSGHGRTNVPPPFSNYFSEICPPSHLKLTNNNPNKDSWSVERP